MLIIAAIFLPVLLYLILDYRGPRKILLRPYNTFGINCLRAKDLIAHEFDRKDNLWASRGMIIYRLKKGDNKFTRIAHIPTNFSIYWLNNFKLFRMFTLKTECVEVMITEEGQIYALTAGYIWVSDVNRKKFTKTLKIAHYGLGKGRGTLSNGLLKVNNKLLFYGEYFNNVKRTSVRLFKSTDKGKSWEIAHEFQPGTIRHIHALQVDPYTGNLWICTGDKDNESMIGWSEDNYKSIIPIGQGNQTWRVCQLVFTRKAIYWGTDSGSGDSAGIYRWDRRTKKLAQLCKLHGAVFFGTRLSNGNIIMSTNRQGYSNEEDDKTRLFIIDKDDKITTIPCGTWNYKKPGFRFNFAKLRFPRNQGNNSLFMSCLNQKEIPDGDLIVIQKDSLLKVLN